MSDPIIRSQAGTNALADKLTSIQYIRAIASIAVVGWHTGWSYTILGQAGVDLFFVLSGFVMMLVSERENTPRRFGLARIARIVPLYWAVTIVVALVDETSSGRLITSLLFWPDGAFPLVIQGWSLNLEVMYYLIFALTLAAPARIRLRLLALGMLSICFVLPLAAPGREPLATWSSPLAFEFLAGACLYRVWRAGRVPSGAAAWAIGIAGAALLATSHLLDRGTGLPVWTRLALWGVPALAIVAAGLGIERAGQLPRIPLLSILGDASYSIYLTHILAMSVVYEPLNTLWAPVALALGIAWACLVVCAVHFALDLPAYRMTRTWLKHLRPRRANVLG